MALEADNNHGTCCRSLAQSGVWVEANSVDGLRSRDTNGVWDFLEDVRNVHQADLVDICEASCV